MKRSTPLKRKTPLRSRGKSSYRRRPRDLDYMKLVRKLACVIGSWPDRANATTCEGRVEADHAGQRALGRKADDTTCIPCCRKHHRERTDMTGTFKHWTKESMRAWCDWAIKRTQEEIAQLRALIPACTCGHAPDSDIPYVEVFGCHDLDCPAEDVPPRTPEALAIWNRYH